MNCPYCNKAIHAMTGLQEWLKEQGAIIDAAIAKSKLPTND